ncbi:MAG: translation initiation factor IF-5A [Candidatus Lokiarchaeota archaeon]|nr:translation initiation factor IF-5A [Candidatus Lokiarchaeota archaeon]MBD3199118.1 translation initiation factor IF-5A [Candidatus Lokiarchaeota archaeon]
MSIRRDEVQKLKTGNYIMVDDEPCVIKSTERSKSGKHGHAKVRIVCVGVFDDNKRSLTIPSGHVVDVPEILKGNAQINFIEDNTINIMDLESYESFDVTWPKDEDMKEKLQKLKNNPSEMSQAQVEYWRIAGKTLINRILTNR